ncbi:winged helix-turn-helix transcriptional regulator [Nonomuraea sp. 3N208]|uniref:winged helix-turn-helix transcriptional regulator n=1 Tax=Nonomuraea sp. 3N208 TaxID=3457421 RepID=UPI003FCF53B3
MQRTRFGEMACSIARTLDVIGEPWSPLILRDAHPRYEYHLTAKGADLVEMLMVMARWGDRWLAGEAGPPVLYRHHACGQIGHVDPRCSHCGEPMHADNVDLLPGPGSA